MKLSFNLTTSPDDMERFADHADLQRQLNGFDGVELMWFGEDENPGIVTPDDVVGFHLRCKQTWYDFWTENRARLIDEFDSLETVRSVYGGLDPECLVDSYKRDLAAAHRYGAEYVVFHVSESTIREALTFDFEHTDVQIVDAAAEVANRVMEDEDGSIALLMENLWYPGLNLLDPNVTRRLIERIDYPNKGIMFDTGHLLHTNFSLATQNEALAYINSVLDAHEQEGLLKWFRGMHLHQSLTGSYCTELRAHPLDPSGSYEQRCAKLFQSIFAIDRHLPFTAKGVAEMIGRLPLEYLTFEFITTSREQLEAFHRTQKMALRQ